MEDEQRRIELCERIRKYCEQQQWYGPDGNKDEDEVWWKLRRRHYDLDAQDNFHFHSITHDFHRYFEFPPATDEQIKATEEALEIPLPPMLKMLYTQVANGGFGPDYGITGAREGYYFGEDGCYETIDQSADSNSSIEYIDLEAHKRTLDDPTYFELPSHIKPAFLLDLCYLGCGMASCIDGKSGRIYQTCAVGEMTENGEWEGMVGYELEAESLEDWLDMWLEGKRSHLLRPLGNTDELPF